jgi:hypothetical protein
MTQEQARQEAERMVKQHIGFLFYHQAVQCALISINREIELLEEVVTKLRHFGFTQAYFKSKLQDLNQIKDELLKM